MPELPEIEVTRRGLEPCVVKHKLVSCEVRRRDLRWPIPLEIPDRINKRVLLQLSRRSKYLLFKFESGVMLVHLGMSGRMRLVDANAPWEKHDHLEWQFSPNVKQKSHPKLSTVRLYDPRRFGSVLWTEGIVEEHPLLKNLGTEPLDENFDADALFTKLKRLQAGIKSILLSGKIIVGVGNIYASEALFLSGIDPTVSTQSINLMRWRKLCGEIQTTLQRAIEVGGSSLKDFLAVDGSQGYFQQQYFVYGREGLPCHRCTTLIRRVVLGQRATFFCPKCQR